VIARVGFGYKDPFILAELEPGEFTIPQGYAATKLIYHWADPKSGRESEGLGARSIYSVTTKKAITPAKGQYPAQLTLPPGEYRVVCGGMPGAMAVLTYTLIREDLVVQSDDVAADNKERARIIDVERWLETPKAKNYNPKLKATYQICGNQVTGSINQIIEPPEYDNGIACDPLPISGTFVGKIEKNIITGTWQVKTAEHKMHYPAMPGVHEQSYDRTDTFTQNFQIRLVLNQDETLRETSKGSGVTETVWGPTAHKELANVRDSSKYNFEISENEITGIWKARK
jgi:hypothetical protein